MDTLIVLELGLIKAHICLYIGIYKTNNWWIGLCVCVCVCVCLSVDVFAGITVAPWCSGEHIGL